VYPPAVDRWGVVMASFRCTFARWLVGPEQMWKLARALACFWRERSSRGARRSYRGRSQPRNTGRSGRACSVRRHPLRLNPNARVLAANVQTGSVQRYADGCLR
jgi:hypothetical protein